VLRGQYWLNKESEQDLNRAAEYFTGAIARDANHAEAYAGRALSYFRLSSLFRPPREVMPKAKADAQRALELDEPAAEVHTTLAGVLLFYEWDWPQAERHLKRAIELSPSLAIAHIVYASYLNALGKPEEALSELRLAQKLDPLSLPVQNDLIFCLIGARQFDEAIAQAHRVLEREPGVPFAYALAAMAHVEKGEFDEAVQSIEKATKILPNHVTLKTLAAHVHAAKGDRREAEHLLAEVKAISTRRFVCAYEVAHVYVKLGDKEQAFQWLEKGKRDRADCMVWLAAEPWMDPLRGDPRYKHLIDQIGLTGKAGSRP
jgi:serine/threonine-protein kinase